MDIQEQFDNHEHNGGDSKKIKGSNLYRAPQIALTTADGGTLTSGGANNLKTADSLILSNAITRLGELESKLQNLGLLQ